MRQTHLVLCSPELAQYLIAEQHASLQGMPNLHTLLLASFTPPYSVSQHSERVAVLKHYASAHKNPWIMVFVSVLSLFFLNRQSNEPAALRPTWQVVILSCVRPDKSRKVGGELFSLGSRMAGIQGKRAGGGSWNC